MEWIRLDGDGWSYGPVARACGFVQHWLGLKGLEPGSSMLLQTSAVHGLGVGGPFRAIGLTESLVVSDVRVVGPMKPAWFRGCRYVVELPLDATPPPLGAKLEVTHV